MPDKKDLYTVEGDKIVRKNPFCPRCGEGVFMADHGDRFACGKCGYTEMKFTFFNYFYYLTIVLCYFFKLFLQFFLIFKI